MESLPSVPDSADWAASEAYLFGCDLYNHAYWWEAHETWEGIWQQTDKAGVQGRFLQGLIQTSACQLKRHMGSAGGVRRLRLSSRAYLEGALGSLDDSGRYMGLAVGPFIEQVARYCSCALPGAETVLPHDPANYPYIELGR